MCSRDNRHYREMTASLSTEYGCISNIGTVISTENPEAPPSVPAVRYGRTVRLVRTARAPSRGNVVRGSPSGTADLSIIAL